MLRYTGLLLVGTPWDEGKQRHAELRRVLHKMDPAWSLKEDTAPTFAGAMGLVPNLPGLDVVHIASNSSHLPDEKLMRWCEHLAEALIRHPRGPWVTFEEDPAPDVLVLIFEKHGIRVKRGVLADAIADRWLADEKRRREAEEAKPKETAA